jgi:hypothetical protein
VRFLYLACAPYEANCGPKCVRQERGFSTTEDQ